MDLLFIIVCLSVCWIYNPTFYSLLQLHQVHAFQLGNSARGDQTITSHIPQNIWSFEADREHQLLFSYYSATTHPRSTSLFQLSFIIISCLRLIYYICSKTIFPAATWLIPTTTRLMKIPWKRLPKDLIPKALG